METTALNYRVIIEPDEETGTGKAGFTAFCPTLGIADDGATVEQALRNIKRLITFHLDCLVQEKQEIPSPDHEEGFVTTVRIETPLYHTAV